MKRILGLLSALLVLCAVNAYAAGEVEVYIDGERLECESQPVNINDRVLVPMRSIFEALDAEVFWDGDNRTVKAQKDGGFIYLPIDTNNMTVGVYGSNVQEIISDNIYLDVPSTIINDRTFVPIRAVSEALSADVKWDGANNSVNINSRQDEAGVVYYTSLADNQRLYSVGKNGRGRQLLSNGKAEELEMYNGDVYYTSGINNYIYKANAVDGEEYVVNTPVNKIDIDENGWLYYQKLDDNGREYGPLYKLNLNDGELVQLTQGNVRYPRRYKNYIYYNVDDDNNMYALEVNNLTLTQINLGDEQYNKLYTFNCVFFGDNILVENGVWYGAIVKMNLDGNGIQRLTDLNSIICKNVTDGDKIIYIYSSGGQDIYCVNMDGSDNHVVVDSDPLWLGVEVLTRHEDTLYYKNTMRNEVYVVNIDGSNNKYVCYADDIKIVDGRLFAAGEGLFVGNTDATGIIRIYDKEIDGFEVNGNDVYVKDKTSSRLYLTDLTGNKNVITADGVDEWVYE